MSTVFYDGKSYDQHSLSQTLVGESLIDMVHFYDMKDILDVGCGNGRITIKLWDKNRNWNVVGQDISNSQIEVARDNYIHHFDDLKSCGTEFNGSVVFRCEDMASITDQDCYDLVFSNCAIHWTTDPESTYQGIFNALHSGGHLLVRQGCDQGFPFLHSIVRRAIRELNLHRKYEGWKYPKWSPSDEEVYLLLKRIGFKDLDVYYQECHHPRDISTVYDFANASLLYYQHDGISPEDFERIKRRFLDICSKEGFNSRDYDLIVRATKP